MQTRRVVDAAMLERRLLFSATPIAAVAGPEAPAESEVDMVEMPIAAQEETDSQEGSPESAGDLRQSDTANEQEQRIELVFVDAAIENYEDLVQDLRTGSGSGDLEIYLLDASRDGVGQVTDILADYRDVDAVHLFSHGNDGKLRLGDTTLTESNLDGYAGDFAAWRSSLSGEADLLLYGCELAESADGVTLLESLAELTGADVAASADDTGSESLGGNWDLEFRHGQIATAVIAPASPIAATSREVSGNWVGLLTTPEISPTDELRVNTTTTAKQETSDCQRSAVAVDDAGDTIVVWEDHSDADGDEAGIFGQRFDSTGTPIGSEFQINAETSGNQQEATVAMDDSGRFVVVWNSGDADEDGIYLRRFDSSGNAIDPSDILVNSGQTAGDQTRHAVAVNGSGQIVLAWESSSNDGIWSRQFDFVSAAPGNELTSTLYQVDGDSDATTASVDINDNGRIVYAWEENGNLLTSTFDFGSTTVIRARDDVTLADSNEKDILVAVRSDNSYVVSYRSDIGAFKGVWVRYVPESGPSLANLAKRVSPDTDAKEPHIDIDESDNVVVSFEIPGQGIYYQMYSAGTDLTEYNGNIQVNQTTTGDLKRASVAIHDRDNLVVVWSGAGDQPGQNDPDGIFVRYFGTQNSGTQNQVPTATQTNQTVAYLEDDGTVALADIVITDADAGDTLTATLTLDLTSTGELTTGTFGSSTSTYNDTNGVWQVSGTIDDVNAALAAVAFVTADDNELDSQITVEISDDEPSGPADGLIQLDVTPVDDPPTIDLDDDDSSGFGGRNFTTTFNEGGGPVLIADTDAVIDDVDSTLITSMTVRITNLQDGSAEELAANTGATGIIANYSGGVLTLSNAASAASYQQVLRTIRYGNASTNPNTTTRLISFVANDGTSDSLTGMTSLIINAAYNSPAIDLDDDDSSTASGADYFTTFDEGSGPVTVIDFADAVLADFDSADLDSLTVTITNLQDGANEILSVTTGTTGIAANLTGGVLTLFGSHSVAEYQQVLRTIHYNNTSSNPNATTRTITFVANDGTTDSNTATAFVAVNASNDAPSIDLDSDNSSGAIGSGYNTVFTEDGGAIGIADSGDAVIEDADSNTLSSLIVTITNLQDGADEVLSATTGSTAINASYSAGVLTLSNVASLADYQQVLRTLQYNNTSASADLTTRTITFTANDGAADSNVAAAAVTMQATNDPPLLGVPGTQSPTEDTPLAISGISVSDADIGAGVLEVTLSVSSGLLSVDSSVTGGVGNANIVGNGSRSIVLVGTVAEINATFGSPDGLVYQGDPNFTGNDALSITGSDFLATDSDSVALNVRPANDAPIVEGESYVVAQGSVLRVEAPGLLANDRDPNGDTMQITNVVPPASGRLLVDNDGGFRYRADSSFSGLVRFSYSVTDGTVTSGPVEVRIQVNAQVSVIEIDAANERNGDSADSSADDSSEGDGDTDDTSENSSEAAPSPIAKPPAALQWSGARAANQAVMEVSNAQVVAPEIEITVRTSEASENELATRSAAILTSKLSRELEQDTQSSTAFVGMEAFNSNLLWDDLTEIEQQVNDANFAPQLFAGTFAGFSGALSVGYVLWTIRSGLLATSLLAHLPAWSLVDPLLVLDYLDDDDEETDDESLENMLDKNEAVATDAADDDGVEIDAGGSR